MALPKKTKDPNEVLDFVVDWSARLDGDTIVSHQAFTADPAGEPVTVDLEVDSSSYTDDTVTVWLSGGELGETYTVTTRVVTVGARTLDQSFTVKLATR